MAPVTCPACGADDLERDAEPTSAEGIAVRCLACGHRFQREPQVACTRCGSGDIERGVYEGWAYDDIEEAREAPEGGTWAYYDREVFRCRKCNNRWRRSGPPRPIGG